MAPIWWVARQYGQSSKGDAIAGDGRDQMQYELVIFEAEFLRHALEFEL